MKYKHIGFVEDFFITAKEVNDYIQKNYDGKEYLLYGVDLISLLKDERIESYQRNRVYGDEMLLVDKSWLIKKRLSKGWGTIA